MLFKHSTIPKLAATASPVISLYFPISATPVIPWPVGQACQLALGEAPPSPSTLPSTVEGRAWHRGERSRGLLRAKALTAAGGGSCGSPALGFSRRRRVPLWLLSARFPVLWWTTPSSTFLSCITCTSKGCSQRPLRFLSVSSPPEACFPAELTIPVTLTMAAMLSWSVATKSLPGTCVGSWSNWWPLAPTLCPPGTVPCPPSCPCSGTQLPAMATGPPGTTSSTISVSSEERVGS
mmetsp:Transcript_12107/g.34030  ORF Transcript_12107/g.34030 Transcript_12107/m.34030 type:complete len:236 (-) Transcript_12107:4318-5025(-)